MQVLVLGSTGYVGTRLIPRLLDAGHDVHAGARDTSTLSKFHWAGDVTGVEVDVLETSAVCEATSGMDAIVYLVHGMGGDDFESVDREAALRVRAAVSENQVERLVYVSGIVPDVDRSELSAHLRSRLEVEEILLGSSATTTVLRAAMILGASSTSYEVMAQISRRLPVTLLPTWMDTRVEPVAVTDVVAAVVHALNAATESSHLDLGGGEQLSYGELIDRFTTAAGIERPQVKIPLVPKVVVTEVASRLVDIPTSTVKALLESLEHDMVANQVESQRALPGERVSLDEALRRALADQRTGDPSEMDPIGPLPGDPDWAERSVD